MESINNKHKNIKKLLGEMFEESSIKLDGLLLLIDSKNDELNSITARMQSTLGEIEKLESQKSELSKITEELVNKKNELFRVSETLKLRQSEVTTAENKLNDISVESYKIIESSKEKFNDYVKSTEDIRKRDSNTLKQIRRKEIELSKREKDVEIIEGRLLRMKELGSINFVRTKI